MDDTQAIERQIDTFLNVGGFCSEDMERLKSMGPLIAPHIPELTDSFYRQLAADPLTGPYIEGRVEQLKLTHRQWLNELFAGDYGSGFVQRQEQIGRTHVNARIPPLFVAASMSFLRSAFPKLIEDKCADQTARGFGACLGSILRLLDFCQFLIDRAYEEDRLRRLTDATGMSRRLLENLVMLNAKS